MSVAWDSFRKKKKENEFITGGSLDLEPSRCQAISIFLPPSAPQFGGNVEKDVLGRRHAELFTGLLQTQQMASAPDMASGHLKIMSQPKCNDFFFLSYFLSILVLGGGVGGVVHEN